MVSLCHGVGVLRFIGPLVSAESDKVSPDIEAAPPCTSRFWADAGIGARTTEDSKDSADDP